MKCEFCNEFGMVKLAESNRYKECGVCGGSGVVEDNPSSAVSKAEVLTRHFWFRPWTDEQRKEMQSRYDAGEIVSRAIPGTEPREYEYRLPGEGE